MPQQYPDDFQRWLASREGSVRRPFVDDSGRPLGEVIETDLIIRLRELAERMCSQPDVRPAIVLLAGGAGNGKSEALELFLSALAQHTADPKLAIETMKSSFDSHDRAVDLRLDRVSGSSDSLKGPIRVVQDASEGDDSNERAGLLLVNDIVGAIEEKWTLVSCVNRGILEAARYEATTSGSTDAKELLDAIVNSLDRASRDTPCWPLCSDPETYVWPMDIESLATGENPAVAQILRLATREDRWVDDFSVDEDNCAIEQNRRMLADQGCQAALANLVHCHEVATGSRWSFRNVFSLVGFLLSGGSVLQSDETPSKLSERLGVSEQQLSLSEFTRVSLDRLRATYPQQLFPQLPQAHWFVDCVEREFSNSERLKALADYLDVAFTYEARYSIERTLRGDWSSWLDPARDRYHDLEHAFNQSVSRGLQITQNRLSPIEQGALRCLALCEDEISGLLTDAGNRREDKQRAGRTLIWFIRKLASTFVKRGVGARLVLSERQGRVGEICDYLSRCESERLLKREGQLLERLFAGGASGDSSYVVRGDHVVGQPSMETIVRIKVEGPDVHIKSLPNSPLVRPDTHYREFEIRQTLGGQASTIKVPYDFPLYQRLRAMEERLLDGSLDPMLRGALDQAKIALDGFAVRGWGRQNVQVAIGEPPAETATITVRQDGSLRFRSTK